MQNLYSELYAWDDLRSPATAGRLVRQYNALYLELSDVTERELTPSYIPYKWYPKNHQLVHIMEDQIPRFGNPTHSWCYEDESNIGDGVSVAEASNPRWLHRSVVDKYRL